MRKKSHIILAKYLVNTQTKGLISHRKAFYIGSILPDCVPSFITKKHSIDETFGILKSEIQNLTVNYDPQKGIDSYFCRHLGIITHYIADYFTFPHNSIFKGSMAEHCIYESKLKIALKQYVFSEEAVQVNTTQKTFNNVNNIFDFIVDMHNEYLEKIKAVRVDCKYIVELCYRVVDAIIFFFKKLMAGSTYKAYLR